MSWVSVEYFGLRHVRNRILWTVQWTNYFCILWMNFMFVISLLLLKRQIVFHNFFLLHPGLACRAVEHSKVESSICCWERNTQGNYYWFPVGFITMYKEVRRRRKELTLIWHLLRTRYMELSKVMVFNPHDTHVEHSHSYLTDRFTVVKWCA